MSEAHHSRPWWMGALALMGLVACSASPTCGGAQHAHVSVDSQLAWDGATPVLAFTWINDGSQPIILQTHVDTEAGVMFDAIVVEQQGAPTAGVGGPLMSIRKSAAWRFCVLPAGQRFTLRITQVDRWLKLLHIDPGATWRASYVVDDSVTAAGVPTPLCGASGNGDQAAASAATGSGAILWHGRADGPWLRMQKG